MQPDVDINIIVKLMKINKSSFKIFFLISRFLLNFIILDMFKNILKNVSYWQKFSASKPTSETKSLTPRADNGLSINSMAPLSPEVHKNRATQLGLFL